MVGLELRVGDESRILKKRIDAVMSEVKKAKREWNERVG